jgi:hypothetical protein
VVHATRPPKSHETPETLYGRWQQEARTLGYEPDRLVREITQVTRAREQHLAGTPAGLPERTIRTMFDRLAGPEGLTEQASTFTRVSVVVGKAGTGKTYALGVGRHAWQLEGLRVVGTAPTGIATVCLDAEGFEHSRTVDALLRELDRHPGGDRGHRRARERQRDLTRTSLFHKGEMVWQALRP